MLMRQHIDYAFNGKRRARVDARDAALGDGRCDATDVDAPGGIELAGVFRGAGNLGAAIDAGCGGADVSRHEPAPAHRIFLLDCDCGVPAAACVSARTMARRARSILKALCSKPLASRSKTSPARVNVDWLAACPRSSASADGSRQGLCATAPSARRASLIVFPSSSSAAATDTSAKA